MAAASAGYPWVPWSSVATTTLPAWARTYVIAYNPPSRSVWDDLVAAARRLASACDELACA